MQKKLSKQNNSGFTLSEVLIAVAILIVLMGLAMIPITRHQRDLRQTELDARAEIVYHAAQNKLSELLANGRISDCYAEDLQPLNNTPLDAAERKTSLYYVTSAAKTGEGSAAAAILPEGQVDRQLWDNHWVIELDPTSGSVYAVFYSEKPLTYDFDSFNPLRFRDGRLSAGAAVGYYGGDSVQSEITGKLTPHMEIINKEQLLLRVTCDTPMEPLHFYVTVSDGVHSTSRIELTGSEVKTDYLTYTATMVLDSLTDGMRFGQQARFKNKNLTPGADLTITVEVTCENRLVDSASGTLTANSLFAEVRGGDTAVVTYARHLQNLDTASRLPDSITRAVQEQDIQFVNENADDGWDRLYGSRTFTPITNSRLTYCESKATVNGQVYHPVIYGLTVNTTGDGGLFAAFSGTLKNLRLCGADITASGNAGGLAGRLSGKTEILDCQVYLSPTRDKLSTKTEQDIWLRGSTAGGLAGRCDGTLTIRRSFAATVIQGVRYAGGLVGNTDSAALTVDHSYADCYLYAAANNGVAGGLIGACNGTANIALSNCYAAGFQSAGTTAGLSGGELSGGDSLKACYSACVRLGTDMKLTYSTVKPPAAGTAPADIDTVYYLFHSRNDLSGTSFVNYAEWSGQNRGTLRNIILLTANKDRTVSLEGQLSLQTACIGALTGCNEGTVYNCAAAGFSVNGDARHGSILYLGGLVGRNSGTVRASGVSAPRLFANSLYATLCAGGFAGGNSGVVQQCYAMADIEIGTINGGGVTLGGFAGSNTGSLRASYCATAMTSPNADIHGFAPTAGGVSGCCYLNGGTYRFVDSVHLYQYTDRSGAAPVNEPALRGMATRLGGFGAVSAANTFQHDKTLDSAGKAYPYPGIVAGHDGSRVHYGDWVTPADMGVLGLLYWEYESKPTGSGGYYFSSIGVEDGVYKTNSSLCTTHDDGGTVTAYGYGYYWSFGSETSPTLQTGSITVLGAEDAEAAAALRHQMPALNFVTYRTANDGLHLTSGTQANDAWTLTHEGAALTYTVSPFFADAFALSSNNAPGTASKPYQVRSIEQLQYINWSYIDSQGSTTRDVTGSNSDYKYYPYLQYTNRHGNALQTKAMALAGDSTGGPRPILTWQQTHDLNGAGHGTAADGTAANYDFHPIAGAVNNGQLNRGNETYDLTLYNWFGGIYDGGNYYIKNVNITSHCYNVGLFGTTAGAEIKNIVLYSDNDAVIQRKTDATPASGATGPENYATSYALGGLVGIAYDYDENLKDKTKVSTISNCAIAGYTVTDNSKNRQFLGEAAIGGLVGVSSANLNRCSAVVKLNINCTHRYANTGAMNKAQWGNYVRVGGLVGGVRYDVSDCYTGGSITVASDLLNERILTGDRTNTSFVDRYESTPKSVKMTQGGAEAGPDTYVYIGGIGGSGFSATFSNFSGSKDGQPTYNNCYTYMTFPAMEGTITGISLIGSIADRAGVNGGTAQLTINNCYYLDSSAAISFNSLPTFYSKSNRTWSPSQRQYIYTYYSLATLLSTDAARMDMLRGKLSYLSKYTWNTGSSSYNINGLTALTYDQMSAKTSADSKTFTEMLNGNGGSSFHWVTTEENGQAAHGKYSFPGSAAALQGQNYPFPTVLTQETQYGTAHLHYGAWPTSGLYWSNGLLSLDRITTPTAKLTLTFSGDAGDELPVITCARDDVVTVSEPVRTSAPGKNPTTYTVEFTGKAVGSTEVFATLGDYTARLLVSVTSTLDISVDNLPGDDFFVGDTCNLTLTARDSRGSALDVEWAVTPQHGNRVLTASLPVTNADHTASVTLTATGEGEDRTMVTATYTAPGGESFTSQLPLMFPVRMQGVLGIANTSVPEAPAYQQGIMTRAGDAFLADTDASAPPYNGAPYTDTPAYTGAPLYLYGQGSAADLTAANEDGSYRFTLSAATVTVGDGTDAVTCDALSGTADYRIFEGQPQSLPDTLFTVRPLTVKGRQPGPVTLTVTLTDAEGRTFTLSIPYTLTEEDTRVTATLQVDGQALALSVPYGTAPTAEDVARLLTEKGISPDTIDSWTPDITQPLYADTAFTAVRKLYAAPVSPSGKEEPSGGDGGEDSGGSGGTSGGDSGGTGDSGSTGDSAASGDAPAPDTPTA